ncbi:STAS domain-containing protein [Botryobacter ruber]|uniref:STAS domain-containing protein n=1 Tax=Botryobacter ruber TaxID=2171629 RepID=UPI000F64B01C|nr:STAS domain-containing protein [Botryobacter ruber]
MRIRTISEGKIYHVRLMGILDENTFPLLQAEMESAIISDKKAIWLDFAGMTGITSEAIAFLTLYQHILQEKGIHILIINLPHHIQFLFNATQLDATIPVLPTKDLAYYMHQNNMASSLAS